MKHVNKTRSTKESSYDFKESSEQQSCQKCKTILTNKTNKWPLFLSLAMNRIEKERLSIPVAAFQVCEQQDFKEILNEIMDKSAFYRFNPGEEKNTRNRVFTD